MKLRSKLAFALAAFALAAAPAGAMAVPSYHPGGPKYQPAPPPPPHAKAHGKRCQELGYSKKHVKGEKGTPFSRCVKAMAQADHHPGLSGKKACKALSKKHVKGHKGTPFSRCVKGVAQMRKEAQLQQLRV